MLKIQNMGPLISLSIVALFSLFSLASGNHTLNQRAQELVVRLNLLPRRNANILSLDPLLNDTSEIVEKRVRFPSLVSETGTASVEELGHHAGYFKLPNSTTGSARMFYYFFESRKNDTNAPVVVWLSGGPGCSSSLAVFYENGPFHLTQNLSLVLNDFGWDQESNIIYLDQPSGTGFSYSTDVHNIPTTSEEAAVHFYNFLQAFFEKYKNYATNDFYITGESYAGHYIPAFADKVRTGNKNKEGRFHINLKGMAIGNGWTNSGLQIGAYPDYALAMNLINRNQHDFLDKRVSTCQQEIKDYCGGISVNFSNCAETSKVCDEVFNYIIDLHTHLNYYDIRKTCTGKLCYNLSGVEDFMNDPSVKYALGVDVGTEFVSCSTLVADAMSGDRMRNLAIYVPALLEDGINVLVYSGEYDLICNWLGNLVWVNEMKWNGQGNFSSASNVTFEVEGSKAGWWKSSGGLTFLMVKDAGHLVPMDQPKAALEMLRRWMKGGSLDE